MSISKEALIALADKWQAQADKPRTETDATAAANAAFYAGLLKCADELTCLVRLLEQPK